MENVLDLTQTSMGDEASNVLELALETEGAPTPEYNISLATEVIRADAEVNARLKAAGFTEEQAQLVYTLAEEIIIPAIVEISSGFKLARELEKLETHFGGEEKFDEVARQISIWAAKHLPMEVFNALNTSYYGVIALYNMMASDEPAVEGSGGSAPARLSEGKLRAMMNDPRYWRDGDKEFIRQVDDGYKELYQEEE